MRRRSLLAASGVLAETAITGTATRPADDGDLLAAARNPGEAGEATVETETILPGTPHETPLFVVDGPQKGPTAMVFGGVHGDEYNGITVAREATDWHPDAGTLVVVPETDRVAVENDRRNGTDGDLNRQFPADGEPRTELARGVWKAVERHDPDVVLDLHRSLGIYEVHRQYVGQAIFYSPGGKGEALANFLNDETVPWYMPMHKFTARRSNMRQPFLFHEAHRRLGSTAYLFETTEFLLDAETMAKMTRFATAKVLELHGLLEPEGER